MRTDVEEGSFIYQFPFWGRFSRECRVLPVGDGLHVTFGRLGSGYHRVYAADELDLAAQDVAAYLQLWQMPVVKGESK